MDASAFESGPLHPGMLESLSREAGGSAPEPAPRRAVPAAPEAGFESGPLHPGMLESLSLESGASAGSPAAPEPRPDPQRPRRETRSGSDPGFESGPLHPGMLQSMALEAGEAAAEPADSRPPRPSLLALDPSARPEPSERPGYRFFAQPLIEHSILDELAGIEERPTRTWPIERAILISIIAHIALVLIFMFMPARTPNPKGGLLDAFLPKNQQESPIPISFPDLPGPSRPNPRRAPLSDADRRAGGGDASKPKAETPFIPPRNGIAGLAPGPRAPRIPGSQVPARPGARAEAERRPATEPQPPQPAEKKQPSEFPTTDRPQTAGPKTETKLAGLDQAIRDAARGTVGGQGGSPEPNPGGGFVDSGPLSFDTKWYDWGPYAAEMIRRIKLHWDVPELARLGWKGSLTVRFFIMADGTVADAQIVRASGIPPFDFAAFQAILKSSKFRPLPADLLAQVPGKDREGITVTFFYNMRLDDEEDRAPGPPNGPPSGPTKKSP